MTHPNETLIRETYAAFSRGDMEWMRNEAFGVNVTYHIAGKSFVAGDSEGVNAVLAQFGRLAEESGGTFGVELLDVPANDERAVAIHKSSATRAGKELEMTELFLYEIAGGKITEAWNHPRDMYAVDAFWA